MSHYEITVALFTIVYGLMLAEIFKSVHKLIRARKVVKWHWMALVSAWYIFIIIAKNWWSLAISSEKASDPTVFMFIANVHVLIVLYLLASAVLPDKIPPEGIDLKKYYFQNNFYFWGLMAISIILLAIIHLVNLLSSGTSLNLPEAIAQLVFISLLILLAFNKKYWLHTVCLILFVLLTILEIINLK